MSIEIISKKLSQHMRVDPDAVLIGDMRTQMARDLLKNLSHVIEKKADYPDPYYILVYSHVEVAHKGPGVIKERIIILPSAPKTRWIGTILFRIDNKNADAEIIWNLPLDTAAPGFISTEQNKYVDKPGVTNIMASAQGLALNRKAH